MKTTRNILIAFLLNLSFSIFELIGGCITGSIAISSDALHDLGDAASIGCSYFLERKSTKQPDNIYTYGYGRFSLLGSVITMIILLVGSVAVICSGVYRLFFPMPIHYDKMILFAVVGVCVNLLATIVTRDGTSLNQKAVNLHMLEDVLGWMVVLIGAIVMRFTNFRMLDALLSIGVAIFILINAVKSLKNVTDLFLEKIPRGFSVDKIQETIMDIDGVEDVHHIHIRGIDEYTIEASMHIVTADPCRAKEDVRQVLRIFGIDHITLETESPEENCHFRQCHKKTHRTCGCGHHHHHH